MCKRKKKLKEYYFTLGHRRCHYCCVQLNYAGGLKNSATVEHVVPRSKGGTLRRVNTLIVCQTCNTKRASKDFVGFVTGSKFPRTEWLLDKYNQAVNSYKGDQTQCA